MKEYSPQRHRVHGVRRILMKIFYSASSAAPRYNLRTGFTEKPEEPKKIKDGFNDLNLLNGLNVRNCS
jgi:hypothetical protein